MLLVCDVETTGLDAATNAVIELAAVPLIEIFGMPPHPPVAWHYSSGMSSLVHPGQTIPPEASAVHHLTDEDLVGAPTLYEVLGRLPRSVLDPIQACAAHNAEYDSKFLPQLDCPWICTWRCSLHLFPDAPSHSLQALRYYVGGLDAECRELLPASLAPHRALYDAICCAALLRAMLITHTWEQLLAMQNEPVLLRNVTFGKHRGTPWSEVPRDYLQWIMGQDFDRDVRHTAQHYLGGERR